MGLVTFKGTKDGLQIILDPKADLTEVFAELEGELVKNSRFFATGTANIHTCGRQLGSNQLAQLAAILEMGGLSLTQLAVKEMDLIGEEASAPIPGPRFIKRTLRSGMQVQHDGDVVIFGDLNPGAEVVASGDILVFGTLRGMVHAGATGNQTAQVAALRLSPTQLRIADLIARSPDGEEEMPEHPEVARIRDGVVVIEEFVS